MLYTDLIIVFINIYQSPQSVVIVCAAPPPVVRNSNSNNGFHAFYDHITIMVFVEKSPSFTGLVRACYRVEVGVGAGDL